MTLYKKVSQIKYIKLKGENIKKHLVFKYTSYNEYLNRSTPSKKKIVKRGKEEKKYLH